MFKNTDIYSACVRARVCVCVLEFSETTGPTEALFACLFVCLFILPINSYGHCWMVSSPNHTFSWEILKKRLTSTSLVTDNNFY